MDYSCEQREARLELQTGCALRSVTRRWRNLHLMVQIDERADPYTAEPMFSKWSDLYGGAQILPESGSSNGS